MHNCFICSGMLLELMKRGHKYSQECRDALLSFYSDVVEEIKQATHNLSHPNGSF